MTQYTVKFYAKGGFHNQAVYACTPKEAFIELKRVAKTQGIDVAVHGIVDLKGTFCLMLV